jgi:hypothetical protein
MNKTDGGKQHFLRDGWFRDGDAIRHQAMWYIQEDLSSGQRTRTQKGVE